MKIFFTPVSGNKKEQNSPRVKKHKKAQQKTTSIPIQRRDGER